MAKNGNARLWQSSFNEIQPMNLNQQEILEQLNVLFANVFNAKSLSLSPDDSSRSIDAWDSVNHMTLIVEVQKHYQVKFSLRETMALETVQDFIDLIQKK